MSVTYEASDGIVRIGFDRPDKHNAFRDEDLVALSESLWRFDDDPDLHVAILFGHGRSF